MSYDSTPLTELEQAYLTINMHNFRAQDGQIFSFPDVGLTVAMQPEFPGSRMANVSLAWASYNEPRFMKNLGQAIALDRMVNGESIKVRCPESYYAQWAQFFADSHY
jgi:hypothetical protein